MECRETGEFAHRELTEFEQIETFNDEVVNAVRGNEEYVHLKSLEDEFHYMESNMPPKDEKDGDHGLADKEGQHRVESPRKPSDWTESDYPGEGKRERGDFPSDGKEGDEYDQFMVTDEQSYVYQGHSDGEDPLHPPEMTTPPLPSQHHLGSYSPVRHSQENLSNHSPGNQREGGEEEEEIFLQEPVSMSRTLGSEGNFPLNNPEDPLNATIHKSFSSTHSSYQSLHEID